MKTELFLVSWSGGYERPSYMIFDDLQKALQIYAEWVELSAESDWVEILHVDTDVLELSILHENS